jgi:hypothetical protein
MNAEIIGILGGRSFVIEISSQEMSANEWQEWAESGLAASR